MGLEKRSYEKEVSIWKHFIHCLCLASRLDDVPARQALASARRHRLPGSRRPHWAQLSGTFGHSGIGFASFDYVASFSLICDVALGFIAFSIGNEFRLSALKHTGKQATVIAIIQALAATILVDITLLLLHLVLGDKLPVSTCIVLGAVATATAPAATIMVVNQYKAKGPLTNLLLPIVAPG